MTVAGTTFSMLGQSLLDRERRQLATPRHRIDALAGRAGLGTTIAARRRGVASIFGYHSVGDPRRDPGDPRMVVAVDDFTASMAFLAKHRRVVPLAHLVDALVDGAPIERHTVVLTVDDGYTDTLRVAVPILERFGLHATVYLSTAYIGTGTNMPIDDVYWSFVARRRNELPEGIVEGGLRVLGSANELEAFDRIGGRLIDLHPDARDAEILAIREALDPAEPPPARMLSWDEVRELAQSEAITLAVHPHRHADLRAYADLLDDELVTTRDMIEAETGFRPVDMSYAYNRQGPDAARRVEALGFRSALGAGASPFVARGTSPFDLMRIDGPRDLSLLRAWSL